MIKVCSLASGSNGNAFYIKTGNTAFLVDAGVSRKQLFQRLTQIGSHISEIQGIFITHEHTDHTRGLDVLLRKHPTPVYVSKKTYDEIPLDIHRELLNIIRTNSTIDISGVKIQSLSKSHDAADPTLFCFYYNGIKISVITDAGYGCDNIAQAIKDTDVLFLETNYDEEMLRSGYYPPQLKRRIASKHGHLSNSDAARLVVKYATPNLRYFFLSHLSENNNTPRLALETVQSILKHREDLSHLETILTSRHDVSPVVELKSRPAQGITNSAGTGLRRSSVTSGPLFATIEP